MGSCQRIPENSFAPLNIAWNGSSEHGLARGGFHLVSLDFKFRAEV